MAAHRFGDGKPGADTLRTLIQVLDGNGLVEVLSEQDWQVVLRVRKQPLLSFDPRIKRLNLRTQFCDTGVSHDYKRSLHRKYLQRFDGCTVRAHAVAGADQR
ncbi:MAG: hypothetical protein MZV64_19590 [Ignavibacteriales bacterium]|nr:hypothetical protein [Ignavibacteriales bacterium]